jgi:hypothetical protein
VDINDDDDDDKNNKVEEPIEQDNKSPWTHMAYTFTNHAALHCQTTCLVVYLDALSSKDYPQRIKASLLHSFVCVIRIPRCFGQIY